MNTVNFVIVLLCASLVISAVAPAKILAILPFHMRSHKAIFQRYVNGLHARGHNLTVVAPYPPQQQNLTNYTFINTGTTELINALPLGRKELLGSVYHDLSVISAGEAALCHKVLRNEEVRKLFTSDESTFDLIILEGYFVHCYLPLAAIKKAPVIWYLAASRMFSADLAIANIQNPAYVPVSISRTYDFPVANSPPFSSRLENLKNYLVFHFYHRFYFAPLSERLCEEYFNESDVRCDIHELFKNVSLVLSNSHNVLHRRATVPNYVNIGGLHIEPAKPLPLELQRLLDESTKKVVYVSFGSLVKVSASDSDETLINAFLDAFATCNCQVVWKIDIDTSADSVYRLPKNVFVGKWFPQRDLLAHRNVKAFISHGGLQSTYEAIYTATPVIGIPLMFDQYDNVRRLAELGVGIHLSYDEVPNGLKTAMREILSNPEYAKNMNKLSEVVQDEPMSPLDRAVFWTEYVIRHNGAEHLRSSAGDLYIHQYLLLDVLGVFILFTVVVLYACVKVVRLGRRIMGRRNKVKAS